jgi:hypothetical protein
MASLPYITSPGNIDKTLSAIKSAAVPERVSQDFVKTILKIRGGSGDQITAYLKKINFATSDGKPTELYTKFRNPASSGQAVAKAIKYAYAPLYVRNEFMHQLSDDELLGLIVEETGQAHDSNPVKLAFACIKALKQHATFENDGGEEISDQGDAVGVPPNATAYRSETPQPAKANRIGLNLGYTINLNLPATTDQAVFNAIFKSLKEHLLRDDDA